MNNNFYLHSLLESSMLGNNELLEGIVIKIFQIKIMKPLSVNEINAKNELKLFMEKVTHDLKDHIYKTAENGKYTEYMKDMYENILVSLNDEKESLDSIYIKFLALMLKMVKRENPNADNILRDIKHPYLIKNLTNIINEPSSEIHFDSTKVDDSLIYEFFNSLLDAKTYIRVTDDMVNIVKNFRNQIAKVIYYEQF